MCGLCGIAFNVPVNELEQRLQRMSASVAHRGPDAFGEFYGDGIALAHRRLSILDLSESGAQPMCSADGHVVVVFNGEIFNCRELKAELVARGHVFRGSSDTEVIVSAYTEWGDAGLERLEGMFAIALWDARQGVLLLVRDRLGIKPLFYAISPHGIVFGSEIKAVFASGLLSRRIDFQALSEYLWFGNAYEDRTIYSQVRSLEPGCRLKWSERGFSVQSWWSIEQWTNQHNEIDRVRDNPIEAVRESIDAAVRRQLVADVPVGMFLSGGIDSSAIAASAVVTPDGRRLRSFSVGFGDLAAIDERPKAKRVADALGLAHESFEIGSFDVEDVVRKLVGSHDEPFADAANIPLFLMSKRLSGKVKVVLQGDGGDELFGGYRRYSLLLHSSMWRAIPSGLLTERVMRIHPILRRLGRIAGTLRLDDPALRMAMLLTTDTLRDSTLQYFEPVMAKRLLVEADPFAVYRRAAKRFAHHDPVTMMLLTDMTVQLPSQFLAKVDRATMANGIEARVPLLDEIVCRTALALPVVLKLRGFQTKVALRAALRSRIPDEIIDKPKMGFGVPYQAWLAGPLRGLAEDVLLCREFSELFGIDTGRVKRGMKELRRGNTSDGYKLWKLMHLALWARDKGLGAV